jgi:signal transduction histidine kinase
VTTDNPITALLSAPLHPDWTVEGLAEQVLDAIAVQPALEGQEFVLDAEAATDRQAQRLLRPLLACLAAKSAAETASVPNLYGGRLSFQRPGPDGSVWIFGHFDNRPGMVRAVLRRSTSPPLEEQFRQSQKMEPVGRLASGVMPDFDLLAFISGNSEILRERLSKDDLSRELIVEIQEAQDREVSLTRQFLAFSRKTVLEPKVLNLNDVVRETEKMLRRLIGEHILLTAILDPTIRCVKVDPGQLTKVLMNLAVNARDAMPKGGKLTVETQNVKWTRDTLACTAKSNRARTSCYRLPTPAAA